MSKARTGVALLLVVLAVAACRGPHSTATPSATASATASGGGTTVRWFVGLGWSPSSGMSAPPEMAFVKPYNDSQRKITLKLESVPSANAYDVLKTEIAAGNAPDIIGPVGVKGRNGFEGLFADLTPYIASNNYEIMEYEQSLIDFFKQGQDQIGLPYLVYPGYIWYNRDIFDKAGLPPLPTRIGEKYQGQGWTWDTVRRLAQQLTLDSEGRKSTQAGFDARNIAQYGIGFQWTDLRRMASCFGGGSFVEADGMSARIPSVWREALNWYHRAIWTDHISPNLAAINSKYLQESNTQASGHLAMNASWGWSLSSIATDKASAKVKRWDIGVMPSYNGATSSPLDADTFVILKASKHPNEAFQAMTAIMADPALRKLYGGMPARIAYRRAYFDSLDADLAKIYPGNEVSWSVLGEMLKVPAVPSHESNMPNYTQSDQDIAALWTKIQNTPGLDVNAELSALQQTLQKDFDSNPPLMP